LVALVCADTCSPARRTTQAQRRIIVSPKEG
jgi:hypothetical protein